MSQHRHVAPTLDGQAFNCAHCHVYAKQEWFYMQCSERTDGCGANRWDKRFKVSFCVSCGFQTIWLGDRMIFPDATAVESANVDLSDDIIADFNEANEIVNRSPRGAAALLRLAIQKLCKSLGQPGKDINQDIKGLVTAGLPAKVQEALDSVRVIGNEAVHPGTLDLRDDRETALQLFRLVNFIAQKMITEPNEVEDIYKKLPRAKRDAIEKRDSKS